MGRYILSLLDRLFDDHPDEVVDERITAGRELHSLREIVSRDVENLLNTRCEFTVDFTRYPELKRSVVTYGLPDFSHMSPNSPTDRKKVCDSVADIILRFEPRLQHVDIQIDNAIHSRNGHEFLFKINALLMTDPEPENIIFDARFDASTQLYRISG